MSLYSGKSKIKLCRKLGKEWRDLADYFEIPAYQRQQFEKGHECQEIWESLESKNKLQELPEALKFIEREDLLVILKKGKSDLYSKLDLANQEQQIEIIQELTSEPLDKIGKSILMKDVITQTKYRLVNSELENDITKGFNKNSYFKSNSVDSKAKLDSNKNGYQSIPFGMFFAFVYL